MAVGGCEREWAVLGGNATICDFVKFTNFSNFGVHRNLLNCLPLNYIPEIKHL